MRYHSNFIKHYISIQDTPEEIAKNLILKTCEVEEVIKRELPGDLLIGKVKDVRQHPQADKLVVCDVDCGSKGVFTICTGGENVVANSFVPVAIPGCYLPAIDLKIEPRTMRGEPSNGMICSKGEIGILEDEDQHWIWTLQYDKNTPAGDITQPADFDDIADSDCGLPLKEKYPRLEAYIFDVDNKTVTNRPDLTGHFGLARELQAMYSDKAATHISWNKLPSLMNAHAFTSSRQMSALGTQHEIPVVVDCDAVTVYSTILLNNCSVAPSSFYTRTILRDCGVQPRNNRVDFGNSFMFLTGQPVHCFDADTIVGGVTVRFAKDGEQFTDLMDTTHTLTAQDIVIADDEKVLALGGIIGGKSSAITEKTKNILIEVAHFDGVTIRKTGTRLALRTDAELRYEKQINPQFTDHAIPMVLDFLQYAKKDIGEHTIAGLTYHTSQKYREAPLHIPVAWEKISPAIFGDENTLPIDTSKNIISQLGFTVQDDSVVVPWWRGSNDMHGLHDITEEIIRIYGYEKVEGKPLTGQFITPKNEANVAIVRSIEEILARDFHMTQVETYPWLPEKYLSLCEIDTTKLLSLINPPAPEFTHLRDSMIYNLLEVVIKNAKIYDIISLFDIGKVRENTNEPLHQLKNGLSSTQKETQECGMIFYKAHDNSAHWENDTRFIAKQALEHSVRTHIGNKRITFTQSNTPYFHTKKQATVSVDGIVIGQIGALHPSVLEQLKLEPNDSVTYACISTSSLLMIEKNKAIPTYETLQDQILSRDFSFVVDTNTPWSTLQDAIASVPEIKDITLFDIYTGDKLPEGKKSFAFSCKIQGDGSLKTENINAIMDQVIAACEKTGATLR